MSTSGFLVLDADIKDGIDGFSAIEALAVINGRLPPTLTQMTPSGGMHYIFRNSTGKYVPSRMNCPAPGVDVRGDGGYIVAAPSVITAFHYTMDNHPIAEAPRWLQERIDSMPLNLDILDGSIKGNARKSFLFAVERRSRY